jgi:hypothetical protein
MVSFNDAHRDAHGVEPICKLLPIAPSTYYRHLEMQAVPDCRSRRARRDEALCIEIRRVFDDNWRVVSLRRGPPRLLLRGSYKCPLVLEVDIIAHVDRRTSSHKSA